VPLERTIAVIATDRAVFGRLVGSLERELPERGLAETVGPWQLRFKDPAHGSDAISLVARTRTNFPVVHLLYASSSAIIAPRDQVSVSGTASPQITSEADAFIVFPSTSSAEDWSSLGGLLTHSLQSRRVSADGRITAAIAVGSVTATGEDALAADEFLRSVIDHFETVRRFTLVDDDLTGNQPLEGLTASKVLRWCLTAREPLLLRDGAAAAISRTTAPGLVWYVLLLWISTVLAPSVAQRLIQGACYVVAMASCAADARLAAEELRNFDPAVLSGTFLLALCLMVLLSRWRFLSRLSRFQRLLLACAGACWLWALFPRLLLVTWFDVVSTAGMSGAPSVVETALLSQDLRGSVVLLALLVTLGSGLWAEISTVRRLRDLQAMRRATRARLTSL
jgi:hypothetical protein